MKLSVQRLRRKSKRKIMDEVKADVMVIVVNDEDVEERFG